MLSRPACWPLGKEGCKPVGDGICRLQRTCDESASRWVYPTGMLHKAATAGRANA